jgi:uncharacterized protein (TIGR02117 family)
MKSLARASGFAVLILLGCVLLYLAAAWVGAHIPVNSDHRPAVAGIPVYLHSNGVHVDLVLPVSADCACSSQRAPTMDVLEREFDPQVPPVRWQWISVGWGSEQFMLHVPTWNELTANVALRAVTGLDGSVLRISRLQEPALATGTQRLLLSPDEYRRLRRYVRASAGAIPEERVSRIAGPGDRFYRATSRYNLFNTCNEWVGDGLARAGLRAPLWSPFDWQLLEFMAGGESSRIRQ